MRISFDLDDTLICQDTTVPREPNRVPLWARLWFDEPLRLGTRDLLRELHGQGHEVWIYTTSSRTAKSVRRWLGFYDIEIGSFINDEVHAKIVRRAANSPFFSKYPPSFGIDLHVDDEDIIGDHQPVPFRMLIVSPTDIDWANKVRQNVSHFPGL